MDSTMTVEEAATYLKVDPVTVQRELRRGRLPGNQVGRSWRLRKEDLDVYLHGGDPVAGFFKASIRLRADDVDEALRVLFGSVLGDPLVQPALRLDLLKRIAILAEAEESGSAKRAQAAAFAPSDQRWTEERFGRALRTVVPVNAVWNKHVVEPFVESLERRNKEKRRARTR